MTAINTLYDIIDKDNTNTTIKSIDEVNKLYSNNYSDTNILFLNIKSIENHFPELECLNTALNQTNHIIITAESWLGKHTNQNSFSLNNYQNIISNINIRKSDGLVLFIRNDIISHNTIELEILDANCLFTTLTFNKINTEYYHFTDPRVVI